MYNCAVAGVDGHAEEVPLFAGLDDKRARGDREQHARAPLQGGRHRDAGGRGGVGFFVVEEGEADVAVGGEAKGSVGPGDYFGEIALIDESPRTATLTARTDMLCYGMTPGTSGRSSRATRRCLEAAHGHGPEDALDRLARAEAPSAVVARVRTHRRDAHARAGVRRVDEAAVPDVDPHVAGAVEEARSPGRRDPREIRWPCERSPQLESEDGCRSGGRRSGRAPSSRTRARSRAAPAVRDADEVARVGHDVEAESLLRALPRHEQKMPPRLGPPDESRCVRRMPSRRPGRASLAVRAPGRGKWRAAV